MQRIGIMGGTFNPIHKGRMAIVRAAKKQFRLNRVIFVPSGTPPHKTSEYVAPKEDRFRMVELVIAGRKNYAVSRVELDRPGGMPGPEPTNSLIYGLVAALECGRCLS